MSDPVTTTAAATTTASQPNVTVLGVSTTPVAPTPPVAGATTPDDPTLPAVGTDGWLKERIKRAEDKGAKQAKKELKATREALENAGKAAAAVEATAKAELAAAKTFLDTLMVDVPADAKATIEKVGGGNVAKTLEAFSVWKASGGKLTSVAPAATTATATAAVVTPTTEVATSGTTAPAVTTVAPAVTTTTTVAAPAPAGVSGPVDHKAVYNDLRKANPWLASQYLLDHSAEIYTPRSFDQVAKR